MNAGVDPLNQYTWWPSLKHGGMLIAPARLANYFSRERPRIALYWADRLRSAVQAQQDSGADKPQTALLDTVLEGILGLPSEQWAKANAVDAVWSQRLITGEQFRPRRLWRGPHDAVLPLFTDEVKQLGIGNGRRSVAKVVEWLRKSQQPIALLTNGAQWRLIHAGPDYEAWCEWEIGLWFEEGSPSGQVDALLHLLGPEALNPPEAGKPSKLIAAIQDTRKGQAELSANLGERVRLAIEHLIHSSGEVIDQLRTDTTAITPRDVYIAATRLVMRCVVILFAEARELLPRTDPIYNESYSLQGLREQLDRMAGGRSKESLRQQVSAWPRLISLFRLIYEGSEHPHLGVRRYGSALFQPGQASSTDSILRALALFEHPRNAPSDHSVHYILELLTRALERVPQGRSTTTVLSPIDFSDLSTEYIGILYEGLLDFQLRRAESPIVFLNIGDQPALPFLDLERMEPDALAKLFEKFKVQDKQSGDGEEDAEEAEEAATEETGEGEEAAPEAETLIEGVTEEDAALEEEDGASERERLRAQVHAWARRAAESAKLVKKPGGKSPKPEALARYERELDDAAKSLVPRTIFPGEWYLIREGNTRKGSGTFYTRPQLAGPIARRALRELAYDGETPRTPEEILALKICDPACGSASFLLSALRFLTEALVASLYGHNRLEPSATGVVVRLADGQAATLPTDETIPKPLDDPEFRDYLRAYLRRHVVERCLYGVDVDPLAVELGRLALWIETMDPRLPFGFLDHKLKCGNALVGCWFDRFQDYPAMAWDREGGDANHTGFVHHFRQSLVLRGKSKGDERRSGDKWTQAIKEQKERVRIELIEFIRAGRETALPFYEAKVSPSDAHQDLVNVFEKLHSLPIQDYEERRREYERHFGPGTAYRHLRGAFDTWCAIWFWPGDRLEDAPMPADFLKPSPQAQTIIHALRAHYRFFHWELEFPDVFTATRHGFDAVIGNPPWEVQKPNSKEFFSNVDPLYRGYGKQEALDRQAEYFSHDATVEANWLHYCARLKAYSNWVKYAAQPCGDTVWQDHDGNDHHDFPLDKRFSKSEADHATWRKMRRNRTGYADPEHPFRHQGSADLNTYKMFLEAGYRLLRDGGRLGLLVPSGIYSDKGSGALRRLFLEKSRWSHLYAFQNERFLFTAVDHRFKVAAVQVEKGGTPGELLTRFRLGPGDSPEAHELESDIPDERRYLAVPVKQIAGFSPHSGAILEIRTQRDLEIVKKLYANGILLGDKSPDGWNIRYTTEFHMTNDSKLFPPRGKWEDQGYRPDEYGHWLKGNWQPYTGERSILKRPSGLVLSADGAAGIGLDEIEDVALPLTEGRMVGVFDFSEKGWVEGKGRQAVWRDIPFGAKVIEPQYVMSRTVAQANGIGATSKVVFMDVTSATNARTFRGTAERNVACGHSAPVLIPRFGDTRSALALAALLNAYVCDSILRVRTGGQHLTLNILEEVPVVPPDQALFIAESVSRLCFMHERFADDWMRLDESGMRRRPWRSMWAVSAGERLRLRAIVDAVVSSLFGLTTDDYTWVMRDCDRPSDWLSSKTNARKLDTKAFWRIEIDMEPELRSTVLAQVAFRDLQRVGLTGFLAANDGEGWMLPETLRLADYGLGHDDRAKEPQPVASALGPRFYPWQLEQSVEESWEECERHAEVLKTILPEPVAANAEASADGDAPTDLFGNPVETDLFGNPLYPKSRRR